MNTLRTLAFIVFASMVPATVSAQSQVFKCTINGTTSFQASPCPPSGKRGPDPTVEQLNAERQKKLREAGASTAPNTARPSGPLAIGQQGRPVPVVAPATPPAALFRCDGRTHCSHMTSCAEAKFFLTNCPGVVMDGDNDGIPCETQWCNR